MARLILIAVGLAAFSIVVLPSEPAFDAAGWLSWGRELAGFDLTTGYGPSWKPLPPLVVAPLTLAGDSIAEPAWLLIARAGVIAMPLLAGRLAVRLLPDAAGKAMVVVAATSAAIVTLTVGDAFTPLSRQFALGLAEPLAAALVLAAADRLLDRRSVQAVCLLAIAGLIRPELLAILAILAAWLYIRRSVREAVLAAVVLGGSLLLWLAGDLAGSGDALSGAGQARQAGDESVLEGLESIWRGLKMPLAASWILVLVALADARDRGDRRPAALALSAAVVFAVVAAMSALGYPGLPRFMLPAVALLAVLAGLGAALMAGRIAAGPRRLTLTAALAAAVVAGALVQTGLRVGDLHAQAETIEAYNDRLGGISDLVDEVGRERIASCGRIDVSWFLAETNAGWELELPVGSVTTLSGAAVSDATASVVLVDPLAAGATVDRVRETGEPLGSGGGWSAYAINCDAAASAGTRSNMAVVSAAPTRPGAGSGGRR